MYHSDIPSVLIYYSKDLDVLLRVTDAKLL